MKQCRNHDQAMDVKTLAFAGPAPILIADLYEIFRRKSLSQAVSQRRSLLYIYLHRLATRRLLKLQRLPRHKVIVLTSRGERET